MAAPSLWAHLSGRPSIVGLQAPSPNALLVPSAVFAMLDGLRILNSDGFTHLAVPFAPLGFLRHPCLNGGRPASWPWDGF